MILDCLNWLFSNIILEGDRWPEFLSLFATSKDGFHQPGKNCVGGGGSAVVAVVAGVVVVARVEVAAEAEPTMAVVLVSPLTLYRPSTTVLIRFALKLIIPEN